ncbi:MAG: hypothetical protein HY456_03165 [Parcubacteria group bacterium]|nr:hypothetical protein [Parcubacteria group bacterium]
MTKGELLNLLTEEAKRYRKKALASVSVARNKHKNALSADDISRLRKNLPLTRRFIDALLADFINAVGVRQDVDYGLYTKHLENKYAEMVLHHDDPPCTERLDNGFCRKCGFVPDMQSTCFYFYCPACKIRLTDMRCPKCKKTFERK